MTRLLIIDDEPLLREVLSEGLSRGGFDIRFAADGASGLFAAAAERPDVIVLDLMLPRVNGFEVIRRLREDPWTARIPILITSAKSYASDRQRALEIGANAFLQKPYEIGALRSRIAILLGRGKAA